MNGAPPPLKRIDHIVALVHDLDSAFATYTECLGFPVSWQVESKDGWRSSAIWLGNASLELLEPSSNGRCRRLLPARPRFARRGPLPRRFRAAGYRLLRSALYAIAEPKSPTRSPAPSLTPTEMTACVATAAPSSTAAARPA